MENADKPDFTRGVPASQVPDGGMIQGLAGGEDLVLARRGDEIFAAGATCTY
jgi:hypothetical protein